MNAQGVVRRSAFNDPRNACIFHGGSQDVDGIIDLRRNDRFKLNHHHSITAGTDPGVGSNMLAVYFFSSIISALFSGTTHVQILNSYTAITLIGRLRLL